MGSAVLTASGPTASRLSWPAVGRQVSAVLRWMSRAVRCRNPKGVQCAPQSAAAEASAREAAGKHPSAAAVAAAVASVWCGQVLVFGRRHSGAGTFPG